MDAEIGEDSNTGPSPSHNPFDLANLLGPSPFAAALSSASGIGYPHLAHIPSAFSMLGPHPMFPGTVLPFGGLGSLGEGLLSPGGASLLAGGSHGASAGGADWWRAASEQARKMAEDAAGTGFYAGLNGSFGSSFPNPMYSAGISPTTSSMTSCESPGILSRPKSSHTHSSTEKSSSSKAANSSPVPKESSRSQKEHRNKLKDSSDVDSNATFASPGRNSARSFAGSSKSDAKESSTPVKNSSNNATPMDYSLENSLLSAEAALYSASPFFFPFGAMAALSSAFGGMPFPGSSMYSCPTTSPDYISSLNLLQSHSTQSTSKSPAVSDSPQLHKSKSESRSKTPLSRSSHSSSYANPSSDGATTPNAVHRGRGGESSLGGNESRQESLGSATSVIVSRGGTTHSVGSSARTLSISDHKIHMSGRAEAAEGGERKGRHRNSLHKGNELKSKMNSVVDGGAQQQKINDKYASGSTSNETFANAALYSQDGAIDLSIKKPKLESSSSSTTMTSTPAPSKQAAASHSASSSSQADLLSAFAQSHQAQILANNQMSAAGFTDPLSFNLAAALLPQMYEGMSAGLFYPPSALAAMAAASGAIGSGGSNSSEKDQKGGRRGRPRGYNQGQGGRQRGRSSSMFISSIMAPNKKNEDSQQKSNNNQNQGRNRGRGRGRGRLFSLPMSYLDLEEQRHQQQDTARQALPTEQQPKAHEKSHHKRESSSSSGKATFGRSHSRRETLTTKLQHHQSKLAQALMGQDGLNLSNPVAAHFQSSLMALTGGDGMMHGSRHLGSGSSMGAGLLTEYDGSIQTESVTDEESSLNSTSNTGSDVESQSTQGSEAGSSAVSCGEKRKSETQQGGGSPKKRKRTILDRMEIQIPLDRGWQRETRIRNFTPKKILGEVLYIAPCGQKIRNFQELEKYLEESEVSDLVRENFTFSTKVNIGKFYELSDKEVMASYVLLSDNEVKEKFAIMEARRQRIMEKKMRAELGDGQGQNLEELSMKLAEARMQKRNEQQELAKKVAESKLKKKAEQQQQKEMLHRARQLRAMELRKMKERQKMLRQQERVHRQQQMKMEREIKNQQLIEEKEVKRQQIVALKEQERERRRHQVLLAKSMDARKKEEEKERLKEEKKSAKKLDREKKLEQKRLELYLAREQKKPADDMLISDSKPLPDFERILGLRLAGKAFSDCLMVLEFVHNFSSSLGFDSDSLPTMNTLQGGLLNENEHMDDFMSFLIHLVRFVIDDPGVANPRESVTQSGQKLVDVDVNENNISELMRIFIRSRNGKDDEMSEWLKFIPFPSLNPTQKSTILAYFCNELLGSKSVTGEIEKNIDAINNMRRDKWIIEGKLRKYRMLQAKRFRKIAALKGQQSEDSNTAMTAATADSKKDTDDEGGDSGDSGDEMSHSLALDGGHDSEAEEDQSISSEELEAKIEKLLKQQNHFRDKVLAISHKLSAMSFGQDRYKRLYWVLPKCGGIYVEGLESAEPESADLTTDLGSMPPLEPVVNLENGPEKSEGMVVDQVAESTDKTNAEAGDRAEAEPSIPTLETEIGNPTLDAEIPSCPSNLDSSHVHKINENNVASPPHLEMPVLEHRGSVIFGGMSESTITNLEDLISQTVMNTMMQASPPPAEDCNQGRLLDKLEIKTEATVKNEWEFCGNSMFKSEKKSDVDDKVVVKEELKCMPLITEKNFLPNDNQYIKYETPKKEQPPSDGSYCDSLLNKINNIVLGVSNHVPNHCNASEAFNKNSPKYSASTPNSLVNSRPQSASTFRSIDSLLQPEEKSKADGSGMPTSNHCVPSGFTPIGRSEDQSQKSLENATDRGLWFSVFPRSTCLGQQVQPSSPDTMRSLNLASVYLDRSFSSTPVSFAPNSRTSTPSTSTARLDLFGEEFSSATIPLADWEAQMDCLMARQKPPPVPLDKQRGWWKISNAEQIKELLPCLNMRGIRERNLQKSLEKHLDFICQSSFKTKKNLLKLEVTEESKMILHTATKAPSPDDMNAWNKQLQRQMEIEILKEIENLEERVCHASLQGWKMSARVSTNESINLVCSDVKDLKPNEKHILEEAKNKLIYLEHNVERRYLKPPLGRGNVLNLANMSTSASKDNHDSSSDDSDADEETASKELTVWRSAVNSATSSAQLYLYMMQLNRCIAWEKSIMKVSCQICCCDDNEAELLLCDICDKGYHTYCIKPKIQSIPDGDWYCYECISKASGDTCCVVCGRHGGRQAVCEICRRKAHLDCLDPPLTRMPKKWFCNSCIAEKGKGKKKQQRLSTSSSFSPSSLPTTPVRDCKDPIEKELNGGLQPEVPEKKPSKPEETPKSSVDTIQYQPSTPTTPSIEKPKLVKQKSEKSREKSENKVKKVEVQREDVEKEEKEAPFTNNGNDSVADDDMNMCRILLGEMRKHDDAWPFLTPVNSKQFPTYRKVIRCPIDFQTIARKLKSNLYKGKEEFASDARLVFNNCEMFNEDDSSVGRAGHSMQQFFERRWSELTNKP